MDWQKVITNAVHAALIVCSCYAAVNPKWAWAIPACQACGQMLPQPNLTVTPTVPKP